jgi:TolB-like protein/Tfp pilus assembly protein PilF
MPSEHSSDVKFEIGHVLFIDIVGYSKLLIHEQSEQLQKLKEIVRGAEQFHLAEAEGKLLRLPTGDGGALVFRNSPEAPVLCALEISKALKSHPELRVRMGIHSGPVNEITDLNEQANIAGAGINIAKRVMDCADAGHILLSKHVAEDLEHYARWRPYLHELGEYEVKHGEILSLVNLYTDDLGNPKQPQKFAGRAPLRRTRAVPGIRTSRKRSLIIAAVSVIIVFMLAVVAFFHRPSSLTSNRSEKPAMSTKSIAILPFENLSEEKANAYFAEGIKDEILTKLAAVRDLKVISRTSTAKYQSKPNNLRTVAQELGVSTILEGAVQRAGDKVRVNVQLINAETDGHLWAKSYDRDFKDILSVESEVAEEIAEALKANLSPSESQVLAAARTQNTEAYDLFLRGEYEFHQAESSLEASAFDRADSFYRQALVQDANFAEAAAALAYARLYRHWFIAPLMPQELEDAKAIIDHALAIAPGSPQAHFALGIFFYWGHRQYENALVQFNRTLELQPNNALARQYCGWVHRRRGEWEVALADVRRAEELDPRDPKIPANLGAIYLALRQWKDAEQSELRALAIDPHNVVAAAFLALTRLNGMGDIDAARRAFDGVPEGSYVSALSFQGDVEAIFGIWVYLDVIERRFTDAFQAFEKERRNTDPKQSQQAAGRTALRVLEGQTEAAKSAGEEALPLLEARLREQPDDAFAMTELAWVYLALARNADALRLATEAAASMPVEKDAVSNPTFQNGLAQIEARAGTPEEAVKRLQHLLSVPAGENVSIERLKIDPVWDPIRNRADFQQLLSGTQLIGPNK